MKETEETVCNITSTETRLEPIYHTHVVYVEHTVNPVMK